MNPVVASRSTWLLAVPMVAACVLTGSTAPVGAHGGTADGTRPFVTGIEPGLPGVAATAVFAGSWKVELSVVSGQEVSVLDEQGRAFLRIGGQGVEADFAAPAWAQAAVAPDGMGTKLPAGADPGQPPQWRPVSRGTTWGWFDPRIRSQPGAVTPEMIRTAVPVRLQDFAIPLRVEDRPAEIKGYVEFEPARGRYVHRLLNPEYVAPGVQVGLLAGQAIPTVTVRNQSGQPVTILGADGEPFLRVADTVHANVASPTWVQVGQALGRTPTAIADPRAEPQWEEISGGHLVSWPDFRSRPPDAEPEVSAGQRIEVRRWTIPLRIGEQPAEIRGATAFEAFPAPSRPANRTWLLMAVAAIGLGVVATVVLRRKHASPGPPGWTPGGPNDHRRAGLLACQTPWLTVSSVMSVIQVPLVGLTT